VEHCGLWWLDNTFKNCKALYLRCTKLGKCTIFPLYVALHAVTAAGYLLLIATIFIFDMVFSAPVVHNIMEIGAKFYQHVKQLFISK